jgi:hypothetical protein
VTAIYLDAHQKRDAASAPAFIMQVLGAAFGVAIVLAATPTPGDVVISRGRMAGADRAATRDRTPVAPASCDLASTEEIIALDEQAGKDSGGMHRRPRALRWGTTS